MRSMTLHTPLRYPGGKRKLSDFFERLLSDNGLLGGDYAEPFAGGAGLALELLKRGVVRHVYLNDIDPHVFAFWDSILNRTEDFCQLVEETLSPCKNGTNKKRYFPILPRILYFTDSLRSS